MLEGIKLGIIFAFIIEGIHFLITIYLTKNIKFKNKVLNRFRPILFFFLILLILYLIFSGFYVVKTNEAIILTKFTGEKKVISNLGIKYSFVGRTESVNLQKQIMKFPRDYSYDVYEIITSDEKPLLINSFLMFKIKDVYKWGIENKDSEQNLFVLFASKTKNAIQKSDYEYIRNNLNILEEDIKEEMLKSEEVYGIEIIDVNLQISDTMSVTQAKSEAESQKINSESLKEAYISESEALKTKYSSLEDKEFIKYMEFIRALKEGDVQVIVVPQNSMTSINLNPEEKK